MTRHLLLLLLILAWTASAATTRNNDSCDISVAPAATLLLPYFEVDLQRYSRGETTTFTVTNVTNIAQVARVTLWTDFSYPVYTFNIYLTGYDVQSINLFDVFDGTIARSRFGTGSRVSRQGDLSEENPALDETNCGRIPKTIPEFQLDRLRHAFTEGTVAAIPSTNSTACNKVGNVHENAVGYVTIDVVGNCDSTIPTDPKYFTDDIRWDNALIGDYQQVSPWDNFAQASPMVHIRAIGETIRGRYRPALNDTFYRRFQTAARPNADARQPLPSTFAARWINGSTGFFRTSFKIWREGVTGTSSTCADYAKNEQMAVPETVVFDEDENGEGVADPPCYAGCFFQDEIVLPSTALVSILDSDYFPQKITDSETSGWIYFNLDEKGRDYRHGDLNPEPLQNWVVVSMRAEGRYSFDMDAAVLGNGCTAASGVSTFSDPNAQLLPGPAQVP